MKYEVPMEWMMAEEEKLPHQMEREELLIELQQLLTIMTSQQEFINRLLRFSKHLMQIVGFMTCVAIAQVIVGILRLL